MTDTPAILALAEQLLDLYQTSADDGDPDAQNDRFETLALVSPVTAAKGRA